MIRAPAVVEGSTRDAVCVIPTKSLNHLFRQNFGSSQAPTVVLAALYHLLHGLKQTATNNWDYHFVLVDPSRVSAKEEPAVSQAEKDLEAAFLQKQQSGSDYAVGEYLRNKGYISVTDFNIVKD